MILIGLLRQHAALELHRVGCNLHRVGCNQLAIAKVYALAELLLAGVTDPGAAQFNWGTLLTVDYDPSPTLLAALHRAGIECSGMFSATGLLPTELTAGSSIAAAFILRRVDALADGLASSDPKMRFLVEDSRAAL